jgi:hypothetical protein
MVYINGRPVTNHSEAVILICVTIVMMACYFLPSLYNFYTLFKKAREPGWAVLIPIYGNIVYARIARKPIWLGVLMGLAGVSIGGVNPYVPAIELAAWIALGLLILQGFVKRYRAEKYLWVLLLLFPLAASFVIDRFVFKGSKNFEKENRRPSSDWSNLS